MPATSPSRAATALPLETGTSPLEKPVLKFEVVDVPGPSRVVAVAGDVVVFHPYGRADVALGLTLPLGSQLQLSPGSSLAVQFDDGRTLELKPEAFGRSLQLGLPSTTEHAI
jgi:hypothetical protein